jgi:hypothetical protein
MEHLRKDQEMTRRSIEVFFYGLFMDVELLRSQAVVPMHPRRAFVEGFTLRIGQRATLIPTAGARAYGMLIALTHHEIAQLYSAMGLQHYLPEAVLAHTMEGQDVAALCYNLVEPPSASERNPAYAAQLKALLQGLGFPAEYVVAVQ